MPAAPKRPRLWLRKARRDGTGKIVSAATWIILDRGKHIATGCAEGEAQVADEKLAEYIADKYAPRRKEQDIADISIADVLSIYVNDVGPGNTKPARFGHRIERLNEFWGTKTLADVSAATCRKYAEHRGNTGGARRDLEDLRSAIRHHAKEGLHRGLVIVTLPKKGPSRKRWLTRQEAARLLWTCWTHQEVQEGEKTKKRPLRHLARFILIGLYTGTRASAIASASPKQAEGRSYVDLDAGIFFRLAIGRRATKKTQTPVRLPPRLLAHMRRWNATGIAREHFVEFRGKPVKSVKTAFARATALAELPGVSPHTLRHTAATWLMQNGVKKWDAADFLGMTEALIDMVYGHHDPDHQKEAAEAIGYRKRRPADPLVVSLAEEREKRKRDGGPSGKEQPDQPDKMVGPAGLEPATRPL